jgi:hypothetical protein
LAAYGEYEFGNAKEVSAEGCTSKVDYVLLVNDEAKLLCEAKAPSVMEIFAELLPPRGFEIVWGPSNSLVQKILGKVSKPSLSYSVGLAGTV